MDFYTLDSTTFKRNGIIEGYTSMLSTERFSAMGDFSLVAPPTKYFRELLPSGTWIIRDGSTYPMKVETIDDKTDATTKERALTITGRSMELMLDARVAMPALAGLASTPTWNITDTPGNVARTIFTGICVSGDLNANDTIPFYHSGTILDTGSIPEPASSVAFALTPDTLYNTLKQQICDVYGLGFRLVRNGDLGQVYFEIYTGNDLTTDQTSLPAVVFSEDFDNLFGIERLQSNVLDKTVAYVFAQNGTAVVYATGHSSLESGFDRRALYVDASDIDLSAGAPLTAAMQQRGLQALMQNVPVYQFDGQIPQNSVYTYGVDYALGDIVEERDSDGTTTQMRVLEQIFVSDAQGDRTYPSFSVT